VHVNKTNRDGYIGARADASTPINEAVSLSGSFSTTSPVIAESLLSPLCNFDVFSNISNTCEAPSAIANSMVSNSVARAIRSVQLATLMQSHRILSLDLEALEDRIRKAVEKAENGALERVEDAKECLETGRKESIKILAELRKDGTNICSRLAWTHEEQNTQAVENTSGGIPADGSPVTPLIESAVGMDDITEVPSSFPEHMFIPRSIPAVSSVMHPGLSETAQPSTFTRPTVTQPEAYTQSPQPVVAAREILEVPTASPATTHALQDIFRRYDEMMTQAGRKTASDLALRDIPWPVLPPSFNYFPVSLFDSMLEADAQRDGLSLYMQSGKANPSTRSGMIWLQTGHLSLRRLQRGGEQAGCLLSLGAW
jgi:hypothetical protein